MRAMWNASHTIEGTAGRQDNHRLLPWLVNFTADSGKHVFESSFGRGRKNHGNEDEDVQM